MLMEEETTKAEQNLANTVTKLALSSKSADDVMRKVKAVENKCSNNEVTLEELDNNLRNITITGHTEIFFSILPSLQFCYVDNLKFFASLKLLTKR